MTTYTCGKHTIIGPYTIIGYPKESRLEKTLDKNCPVDKTVIGNHCLISTHVTIYEGCHLGNHVYIDDFARVGYGCIIGDNTRVEYNAFICDRVKIGKNCVVSGFVGDRSIIKDNCVCMGSLIHELSHPHKTWGYTDEPAAVIEKNSVVGFGATVVGGVTIGPSAYVAAGAVVTKNVPPQSIVTGTNKIIPFKKWRGKRLDKSFFKPRLDPNH